MTNRTVRTLLATVCATLALSTGAMVAPTPALAVPPSAPSGDAELQALLDELVAAGASGALAVVDDGQRTWRVASGAARLQPRQPLTVDARFRVGSMTKSFVAVAALQLVAQGRLRLDDTVERWLPGLVPDGQDITLRMLLNHTSGLFDFTADEAFLAEVLADPTKRWSPYELIAVANRHPPTFPPGAGWSYSNTGYIVAGLMIETASGRDLEWLIRHRIIKPLRLNHTTFPTGPNIPGYHAHGYLPPSLTGAGYQEVTRISPSAVWAAGAMISNAADLRTFYEALLGGRLLPPAELGQMLTTVPVAPGFDYGLGIYAEQYPCGTAWGHNGAILGYLSWAYTDRSGRRSVVFSMPTEPDVALWPIITRILNTAVCRMFGQNSAATAAATTGQRIGPAGGTLDRQR